VARNRRSTLALTFQLSSVISAGFLNLSYERELLDSGVREIQSFSSRADATLFDAYFQVFYQLVLRLHATAIEASLWACDFVITFRNVPTTYLPSFPPLTSAAGGWVFQPHCKSGRAGMLKMSPRLYSEPSEQHNLPSDRTPLESNHLLRIGGNDNHATILSVKHGILLNASSE
jgi:hypothetical protein